jgi:superfamily II DNA or RNA helicase
MISLRPYQEIAIQNLRQAYADGHKKVILCAPTGAGKTIMFSAIAQSALQKGKRVMILTDRGELLWQAGGALNNLAIVPELITAETTRVNSSQRIFVAMIETIYRRAEQRIYSELLNSVDLFIFDECHKRTFDKIVARLPENAMILGATATPVRDTTGKALKDIYTHIVEAASITHLVDEGYLANPHYYSVRVDLKNIGTKGGDFDMDALARHYQTTELYKGVVDNYKKHANGTKALLFAPNLASADEVLQEIQKAGYQAKSLDASASREERRNTLKWYKETPGSFLVNVGLFTTGFDEPTVETVILYRATKSLALYLQMIGRGSRTTENKKDFRVLDFGNNLARFGLWDADREWSLDEKIKKKTPGVPPMKHCPQCESMNHISAKDCAWCGLPFEKSDDEKIREYVMLEKWEARRKAVNSDAKDWALLTKAKKVSAFWVLHKCCKTMEDAENYRDAMGYKKGWLYYHKDRTGHLR